MRNLILTSLIAASVALIPVGYAQQGGAAKAKAEPKSKKLTRAEFDTLLSDPSHVVVVDVRRPDEVTAIGGFPVYLSIQAADLEKSTAFIPKDRTVITVSNHAARGLRAADLLDSKGFKVAGAIGVEDYAGEGGHVTKIVPPPPAANNKK
jgi:rhodanese-related sulfurtransferase